MERHATAVVLLISLALVGCTPLEPAPSEPLVNNTSLASEESVVAPAKVYSAAQVYAEFSPSVVVVETNCTYNFTYRDFELKWRQAVNAEPTIYLDERPGLRSAESDVTFSGTGYRRNGNVYTNSHVVDCDDAENETKDDLQAAYSGMVRGGYVNPDRFAKLTHLDVDAEAAHIFAYVQEENPDEYSEEDIRRWITWRLVDYLVDHSESISVDLLSETHVVRTEADDFTEAYPAMIEERGDSLPEADYAILAVDNLPAAAEIRRTADVTVGEDLYIVGFPVSTLDENKTTGVLRESPVITKGIASSKRTTPKDVLYYAVDAASRGGSSGSPVLNERGELLGMLTAGYDDSSLSFILAVKEYE